MYKYKIVSSIVTYNSDITEVKTAAMSFKKCSFPNYLVVIDNCSELNYFKELKDMGIADNTIMSDKNLGFGYGHNIGIANAPASDYYLVLNPDIEIHNKTLEKLVEFMDANPEVGLVSPKILNPDGTTQHLNKREPTVFNLFARRFLPSFAQKIGFIKEKMDYYTMMDKGYDMPYEVPYVTGCFMLFRRSVLDKIGGFDEKFFLYLEEADITRRVNKYAKSFFYPYATVTHQWARGSHNDIKLTWITIKSAIYYFNKWGWRWI